MNIPTDGYGVHNQILPNMPVNGYGAWQLIWVATTKGFVVLRIHSTVNVSISHALPGAA